MFTPNKADDILYMTSPVISAVHAFTTRYGGVSEGHLASLNLGERRGDAPQNVRENYRRICKALGVSENRLVFSRQVHKNHVKSVSSADIHTLFCDIPYEADGLVTAEKDLTLVIFSADCLPVLLHDPVREVIAAVHAGWRGTVSDIVGEAVRKMICDFGCSPENIRAAIGPGISSCCFETDAEVPHAVREVLNGGGEEFISPRKDKFTVDLKGVNTALLLRAGVLLEHISVSDECTMCKSEKYWSHRLLGDARGSQAAFITQKGQSAS